MTNLTSSMVNIYQTDLSPSIVLLTINIILPRWPGRHASLQNRSLLARPGPLHMTSPHVCTHGQTKQSNSTTLASARIVSHTACTLAVPFSYNLEASMLLRTALALLCRIDSPSVCTQDRLHLCRTATAFAQQLEPCSLS